MAYHSQILSLLILFIYSVHVLTSPLGNRYRATRYHSDNNEGNIKDIFPRDHNKPESVIDTKNLPTIPVQGPKSECSEAQPKSITITKIASGSISTSITTRITTRVSNNISTKVLATTVVSMLTAVTTHEVTISVMADPQDMQIFTLTVGKGESIATLPSEVAPTAAPVWNDNTQYQSVAPAPIQPPLVPIVPRQAPVPVAPAKPETSQYFPPPAPNPAPLGPHYDELYGYTPIGVGFSPPPVTIGPDGSMIFPSATGSLIGSGFMLTGSSVISIIAAPTAIITI